MVVLESLLRVSLGLSTSERAKENLRTAALKRRTYSVPSRDVAIISHRTVGVASLAESINSAYLNERSSARWG